MFRGPSRTTTDVRALPAERHAPLGLIRPRLHRDRADAHVVVAYGPAGCGKTTFLQQHASRWAGPVVWLDCDGLTRSPEAFARRLGQLLGNADDPLERLSSGLHDQLIVIDDIDRLPGVTANTVVDALIGRLPPGCAVGLGTRRLDALADLERWRVAGKLRTVDSHDLRFRLWEVDRLFRDVYKRPLTVDELHGVSGASGGWPVALYYFGVALRQDSAADATQLISQIGRSNLRLRRYLRSQVLVALPIRQRRSLRHLAVFDRVDRSRVEMFAPELVSELFDLVSIGVLEENPTDGTFRMHSLLRAELLDELVAERSEIEVRDLYLEAAQVLERVGESHEAALARARAGHRGTPNPTRDAVALHAAASLDLFAGDSGRACEQLEAAVALFDEEGGNSVASRQLRLLNDWLASPRGDPTSWVSAIRMVLEGRRPAWTGPNAGLVDATRLLIAGEANHAHRSFIMAEHGTHDPLVSLVASLGAGLCAVVAGRNDEAAACGRRAWARCRDDGSDAFALVAEALMLSSDGPPGDVETLTELGDRREDAVLSAVLHVIAARVQPTRSTRSGRHRQLAVEAAETRALTGLANFARRVGTTTMLPTLDTVRRSDDPDDTVEIVCIGGFAVRIGGRDADLGALRPKHRELLAALSARPNVPCHREELIDALWPSRSIEVAKPAFYTAVSAVRGWLEAQGDPDGRGRIERQGDAYLLRVPPASTDLGRLLDRCATALDRLRGGASCVDDLRDVVERYHDEPFRGFGPVEWAVRVRRTTRAVVEDLVTASEQSLLGIAVETRLEFRGVLRRAAAICGHDEAPMAVAARQLDAAASD